MRSIKRKRRKETRKDNKKELIVKAKGKENRRKEKN